MFTEIFPFQISLDATTIAGSLLWSLTLYLAFFPWAEWVMGQLNRWFNFAERSLYTSQAEFERTRKGRELQNAFLASVLSIVPFMVVGSLCNYGVEISMGRSWAVSVGLLGCVASAIYELGRRDGQAS